MSRNINEAGRELVKSFERFCAEAYVCPAGVWTIGYGHTGGVVKGQRVTVAEAEELLSRDLAVASCEVEEHVRVPLNDNQFSALVSFVFNVGGGNLQASTLCRKLNGGEYDAVPGELKRWVKAVDPKTGKKRSLPGLVRRRAAEAGLWMRKDEA